MDNNKSECNLYLVNDLIGGKWKIIILYQLDRHGTLRYSELKKFIDGITGTMLSQSLKELERDNLITRKQYNEKPLRVEYSIEPKSEELLHIIHQLHNWSLKLNDS
jgi:DNA-binding HxlR family transcriptional regulator